MAGRLGLTILTGFLGAGKTTLLNRLLKDPAAAGVAVIINEFGEISIDHLLVEKASEELLELGNGCVCCTARGPLVERLAELAARPRQPTRVVIETTGLADPAALLRSILADPGLSRNYRLERVITVVDAVNGLTTLAAHDEAARQVAIADTLVVTKADLATEEEHAALGKKLAALNPLASIVDPLDATAEMLAGADTHRRLFAAEEVKHLPADEDHAAAFQSIVLRHDGQIATRAVENFLDLLASQAGERILRIKGLVKTVEEPDRPLVVQGAQKLLHALERLSYWPGGEKGTRIVVIGKGIDADYVRSIFAAFAGQPAVDTPDRAALEDNPLSIAGLRL